MEIEFKTGTRAADQRILTRIIFAASARVSEYLPLQDVSFTVEVDESQVIPEWGVGGYCEEGQPISLAVEEKRQQDWERYLPPTIFHEWHHLARWRGPGYGKTLLEVMISEGLAQHFEVEVGGGEPPVFCAWPERQPTFDDA